MIYVTYWRKGPLVRARGHAGAGPKGQDLVCAAVTALLLTLRENGCGILEPGRAEIRGEKGAKPVFDGISRGFSLLAEHYPGHITYEIRG